MGHVSSFQSTRGGLPAATPPPAPPAAAESYQAGGTPAAMAAIDLRSESRARDTLLRPEPSPAFGQEPFVPQQMDIPRAMGLAEFVAKHYPGLKPGAPQPKGTNASVLRSYKAHLAETAKGRKTAMVHNNQMGLQRETLDLKRAEFNAKEAARRLGKEKFATFEAMVVSRMGELDPGKWADDPAISFWARMKSATSGVASGFGKPASSLPSAKEHIAEVTVKAAKELEEIGEPGPWANVLVLMTDPVAALKLLKGAKNPKTLKQLEAEAVQGVIDKKKLGPEEALEVVRSGGKKSSERSILTPTKFGTEVFGEMGGFGGIVKELKDGGMDGFISVLDRFQSLAPTMDDRQRAALEEIIRARAPTPQEIVAAGPAFTGADGKKRGGGNLTEEQVEAALRFVITPEQRRQLGQ